MNLVVLLVQLHLLSHVDHLLLWFPRVDVVLSDPRHVHLSLNLLLECQNFILRPSEGRKSFFLQLLGSPISLDADVNWFQLSIAPWRDLSVVLDAARGLVGSSRRLVIGFI